MYNSVASAGRVILDLIQSDWEPLSDGELERRLDHALEEILEADLRARAFTEPVYQQQPQGPQQSVVMESSEATLLLAEPYEENDTIQYIKDILQNSDSSYNRSARPGRPRLSLNHTILLSLTLLSSRLSYRSVSSRFHVEKGNIHRIFFSFCERVNALEKQYLRWPTEKEAEQNLKYLSNFPETERLMPCVPKVFGILGCTRIPLRSPVGKEEIDGKMEAGAIVQKDVHPDSWLNLELVCDTQGKFIHCRISRGSDTDKGSALKERLKQQPNMLPKDCYLVARLGYPLSSQILTPYPVEKTSRETLYNQSLETHLDILYQAIAELKSRFQRLQYLDMVNFERARAAVLTACILHNMFLAGGDRFPATCQRGDIEVEEEGEVEEDGLRTRETIVDLIHRVVENEAHMDGQ